MDSFDLDQNMPTNFGEQLMEQPLTLASLALDLNADSRLSGGDLERVRNIAVGSVHPAVYLAEQKLADPSRPGKTLDMEAVLSWLGDKSRQGVYEIDPLKINLGAITEVMSRAFAQRHRILAVEVSKLLEEMRVVRCQRPAGPYGAADVVMRHGRTVRGGQLVLRHGWVSLCRWTALGGRKPRRA